MFQAINIQNWMSIEIQGNEVHRSCLSALLNSCRLNNLCELFLYKRINFKAGTKVALIFTENTLEKVLEKVLEYFSKYFYLYSGLAQEKVLLLVLEYIS